LTGIGSGAANENQSLTVTAVSSDTGLVLNPSVSYTSPNATGTLTFNPVPGASGAATISVTVNDGQSANNLFTRTFAVTISQPPTISVIPDQLTAEDTPLVIPFSVNDLETPAGDLIVSGVSSNPALLPGGSLVLGGSGSSRTLTLLPVTNAFGAAFITLTVTDAQENSAQSGFLVTVSSVPDVPAILNQPQSQTVTNSATVRFQVTAASGLGPLQYQWQRGGVDLPGQTNATFVLASAQPADAGQYRVLVSNPDASVSSAVAELRVLASLPVMQILRVANTNRLSFSTIIGPAYTIEYQTNLGQQNWLLLGRYPGTGNLLLIEDVLSIAPSRFYRLRVE
jgi:hypothetical protein